MRIHRHIRSVGAVSLAVLIFFALARNNNVDAQELPKHFKSYFEGRLTSDDFQGKKTESHQFAYTWTKLRFDYRCWYQTRGDVTTAKLTEASIFAVFDRNESWNVKKKDAALLDHEQGHFDISQLFALRIHLALLKQVKSGNPITTTGQSNQDADTKIAEKIVELIDQSNDDMEKAHQHYDQQTQHGLRVGPQTEFRKKQRDAIRLLNEEIKRLSEE